MHLWLLLKINLLPRWRFALYPRLQQTGKTFGLRITTNFYTSVMGEVAVISDVAIPRQLHLLDKSQFIRFFDIASGDAGGSPTLVKAVNIPALVQTAIDFSQSRF